MGYFQRLAADPTAFTLPNGLFRAGAAGPMPASTLGTRQILVVPALFSDSPDPHVTSEQIGQLLFQGPAPRGTLTQAYLEMSRGKLTVEGTVTPWVRTGLTLSEVVGASAGLGGDAKVGAYLLESLRLVDEVVDFRAFDNDGPDGIPDSGDDDGVVDAIAFEFLEVAGSCGGPGIWPHLWGIAPQNESQPFHSQDIGAKGLPIQVNAYIIQSAVDCGGVEPQDAAVIAHEFGHVLGLPDYYHPTAAGAEGRRWVLGCWELMAAGSWGCGPHGATRAPFGPTHMSARSKNAMGWLDYVTVGEVWDHEIVMDPVQATGQALRIPLDAVGREFLLVEYRTREGFDRDIPADGVLIYHQDFQGAFRPAPGSGTQYFLSILEQDDNAGLVRNTLEGGNRGEAGDAWGVGGVERKLHFNTVPFLRLHAGGSPTPVTFHEIVVDGGKARIRLSNAATPRLISPEQAMAVEQVVPFERRFRIAGGYMPYVAGGSVPAGVTVTAEDDELVIRGSIDGPGPFEMSLRVTDARGTASSVTLPLTGEPWQVGEDRLLQSFLGSGAQPLNADERAYLDLQGNRNGRYDVGDLRAWLRRATDAPGG